MPARLLGAEAKVGEKKGNGGGNGHGGKSFFEIISVPALLCMMHGPRAHVALCIAS